MTRTRGPLIGLLLGALVVLAGVIGVLADLAHKSSLTTGLAANPNLDPGTPLSGPAPDFTLTDEYGRPVSLHSFRGRVVVLAFNDSQCTTICPLTTTAMVQAKSLLGPAGARVQLLGVDANPAATSVADVHAYSQVHGMLHSWRFLTSSLPRLQQVWRAYKIDVAIEQGQIDHTPALFVIGPDGRLAKLYLTQMAYDSVGQLGELLAQEASSLLPDHPPVRRLVSYSQIAPYSPTAAVALPRTAGGTITLGTGSNPRLVLFFATWVSETSDLARELDAMNGYTRLSGLPPLVAVDEGSVEPSPGALPAFLRGLRSPLAYPVAVDRSGRVADGYGVQDQPWLVLLSPDGRILWYDDVSTQGWLTPAALAGQVRAALTRPRAAPTSASAVAQELAGSPQALATIHRQSGQLLGTESALAIRLRALRGYPVVLNAWASWCGPCRTEFELFASASARFGRRVAFLGADTNDSPGDAQTFLANHPVSYPSYQTSTSGLGSIASIFGLPTTVFISANGKVAYVHSGQYFSEGTLDDDITRYALGG